MRMSPPLAVTEDTPADMLAGSMDLDIVLPSGQVVRNSVQRSTPMMDLLVQITTAHRLSPGSHSLQAMGERGVLPYKPSTPIGALDTFTVQIVQKKTNLLKKAPQVPTVLPTTFRLSVHLPRSQLFVMRVTPAVTIGDIMQKVSDEKNLDVAKYELRKPGSMNQPLKSNQPIGELDTQELTLVERGADHVRQMSSADIMHVKQANRLNSAYDSSLSSGSMDSRSISPVAQTVPQVPQRKKRRPAPKPPEINQMRISHSRESSDSSGYHEPSTLSESPTHGGPPSEVVRRGLSGMAPRNSHSLSNLTSLPGGRLANSSSVTSLSSNGGKKKRAPPPPSQPTPTVNGEKQKSATLPADARPPAPVELAPSPPTSPDSVPPVPKPRLSKTTSLRRDKAPQPPINRAPEEVLICEENPPSRLANPEMADSARRQPEVLNSEENPLSRLADKIADSVKRTQEEVLVCEESPLADPEVDVSASSEVLEPSVEVNQVPEEEVRTKSSPPAPLTPDWEGSEKFNTFASVEPPKNDVAKKPRSQKVRTVYPTVQTNEVLKNSSPADDDQKSTDQNPKSLRAIRSSPVLTKRLDVLPKIQSADMKTDGFEFNTMSRWEEVSNLAEIPVNAEFLLGSSSTLDRRNSTADSDKEMLSGDTFEEETSDVSKEPATTSSEGPTTDGESQPDSLTVDWEYQLPPPPSHFRDLPAQVSPSPTDAATRGTLDTLNTLIVDKGVTLRKLNGIYEDSEPEVKSAKKSLDEPDRVRVEYAKKAHKPGRVRVEDVKVDEPRVRVDVVKKDEPVKKLIGSVTENGQERKSSLGGKVNGYMSESEKVLVHKSEVMSELTNMLTRNRLPEKSQSYSNLFFPSAQFDLKKKSSTLSHSQSFLNPPIANFKIANYDERPKPGTDGFKKPAVPASRPNGVRRADSMNVKKVTVDSMEKLQQQFMQFLQEKELLDSGVELEDLNVVPVVKSKIVEVIEDEKTVGAAENRTDVLEAEVKVEVKNAKQVDVPKEVGSKDTERMIGAINSQIEPAGNVSVVEIRPKVPVNDEMGRISEEVKSISTKVVEMRPKEPVNGDVGRIDGEVKNVSTKDQEAVPKIVAMEPKREPARRSFYQPPAISMGAWGDQPRAKVVIKDDDYITQAELTEKWATLEKSASMSVVAQKAEFPRPEPKAESTRVPSPEKKTVISFKKPKNYELFSALNRRKELEREDEVSRLPKVCGVELKKEFQPEPDSTQVLEAEKSVKVEEVAKYEVPKTTSVYLNGAPKPWNVDAQNAAKVRPGLMPVVKGFRSIPSEVSSKPPELVKQESFPTFTNKPAESFQRQQSLPAKVEPRNHFVPAKMAETAKSQLPAKVPEVAKSQGIPAPPPMGSITLKPVGARVIKPKVCDDPRDQLLEQIRSFGGTGRLRKTAQ